MIYRPLIKKALHAVLVPFSARNPLEDGPAARGIYKLTDANERLFKNVRVACKSAEGDTVAHRRKFVAGLNKCGYWVPLVAWENAILAEVMEHILQPAPAAQDECAPEAQLLCTPIIPYEAMADAINFMWARYSFGQAPELDSSAPSTPMVFRVVLISPLKCLIIPCPGVKANLHALAG